MIFAFLATRAGKFAMAGLAVLLAVVLFAVWLDNERDEAVEADRLEARAKTLDIARRADAAAQATTAAIQNEVEQTNDQARDAARNSPDPLRDGFSELRRGKAGGGPAPRKPDNVHD